MHLLQSSKQMSYKYQAQKIGSSHWVLPKIGDMKCEIHAFLSENLYQSSEEELWNQIANAASYPGVIGAYLQPDTHVGYGIPVGGVVVTEDTIIQSGSGYDIGCGIMCLKVPGLYAQHVKSKYKRESWIREVENRVQTGLGSNRPKHAKNFSFKQVEEVLRYGAKALGTHADLCERQYIKVDDNVDLSKIESAYKKAPNQLGSMGQGNHHQELQVDKDTGEVYITIHTGSRGYGYQTANHFFYEGARLRGLQSKQREKSWLRIDEPLGKEYWNYHNSAANYAIANRHVIVNAIQEALEIVFNVRAEIFYEISHNLVQEETLLLPDGTIKKGFVHRKGATRAFPAGHPDLVGTRWEKTGHPCCVPGSMYTGAAILFPSKNAAISGCSVNHGAGRVLARNEAKRKLKHKQLHIDQEMANVKRTLGGVEIEGIITNTKHVVLDECNYVYKDLDEVLKVLEDNDIAKVKHRLYPVANIKDH